MLTTTNRAKSIDYNVNVVVISNFAPPKFRKVKPPEIGKVKPPIARVLNLG